MPESALDTPPSQLSLLWFLGGFEASLARRIRCARLDAGYPSQAEFARACGLSVSQIQKIESTGRLSVSRLILICRVLELEPGVILTSARSFQGRADVKAD